MNLTSITQDSSPASPPPKRVAAVSLGCSKNLVDTEIMLGILQDQGYEIILDEQQADILIINTCAFIKSAVLESKRVIKEAAQSRDKQVVVTGCLVQRYGNALLKEFSQVSHLISVGDINRISQILNSNQKLHLTTPTFICSHQTPRLRLTLPHTTYLKIADGCNNCCSYCLIPQIRGRYRSRTIDSILLEVNHLVQNGVKELNLIAQDTTLYGMDIYAQPCLDKLLKELAQVDGLRWIRLLYTHPGHFSYDLIEVIASEAKICKYIDLPLQHIDNTILKAMNRQVDELSIRQLITDLHAAIPDLTLRTSLMVGFPGETDESFQHLLDFVKEIEFERLGVFIYSKEGKTPAASYPNPVAERIKKRRYHQLLNIQQQISLKKNQQRIGQIVEAVVERIEVDGTMVGRTAYDAPDIDGLIFIHADSPVKIGDFLKVKVTQATEYDLLGISRA